MIFGIGFTRIAAYFNLPRSLKLPLAFSGFSLCTDRTADQWCHPFVFYVRFTLCRVSSGSHYPIQSSLGWSAPAKRVQKESSLWCLSQKETKDGKEKNNKPSTTDLSSLKRASPGATS